MRGRANQRLRERRQVIKVGHAGTPAARAKRAASRLARGSTSSTSTARADRRRPDRQVRIRQKQCVRTVPQDDAFARIVVDQIAANWFGRPPNDQRQVDSARRQRRLRRAGRSRRRLQRRRTRPGARMRRTWPSRSPPVRRRKRYGRRAAAWNEAVGNPAREADGRRSPPSWRRCRPRRTRCYRNKAKGRRTNRQNRQADDDTDFDPHGDAARGVALAVRARWPLAPRTGRSGAGPNRDGAVAQFTEPATWPAALTKRWQVEVGTGYATPVMVGDRVFVFTRQAEDEVLTAFDAATGQAALARILSGRRSP